jgi:hypothetical protein
MITSEFLAPRRSPSNVRRTSPKPTCDQRKTASLIKYLSLGMSPCSHSLQPNSMTHVSMVLLHCSTPRYQLPLMYILVPFSPCTISLGFDITRPMIYYGGICHECHIGRKTCGFYLSIGRLLLDIGYFVQSTC